MSSRGGAGRGRGRATATPTRGRGRGVPATDIEFGDAKRAAHVATVGVKRPTFGTAGREIRIHVNSFAVTIPSAIIHHYDVISPSEKVLPARVNLKLITALQTQVAPEIFTPKVVYDGKKNVFAIAELPFGEEGSKEFDVPWIDQGTNNEAADPHPRRNPKVYKIRLTKVAEINTEVLKRFIEGIQSADPHVLTAITAFNVVVRMEPIMNHPFNVRSFFTNSDTKDIKGGLVLWRGLFQSVRPALGQMTINVDTSTGIMYKQGNLVSICLEIINKSDPQFLSTQKGFPDRERLRLQRNISGIRIQVRLPGSTNFKQRVIKGLTSRGADQLSFKVADGRSTTVADYYRESKNYKIRYPSIVCAEVGAGNIVPLELCYITEPQMMRKQIPADKIRDILAFATKPPRERLQNIRRGIQDLAYGQSEYVRQFGLHVNPEPLTIKARVLAPPTLRFGKNKVHPKGETLEPKNGSWNMKDRKYYEPSTIAHWLVVIFETERRFPKQVATEMVSSLVKACNQTGIQMSATRFIQYKQSNGDVWKQLDDAGRAFYTERQAVPQLFVVVIPDGPAANEVYTATKHFGDVDRGIPTQCMKSTKCSRGNEQYFANISLKVNVKLGGINTIPVDELSKNILADPAHQTIVMGADVIHPSPGSEGRPSFTALVGNVDKHVARYVSETRVQTSRQEIIADLGEMTFNILSLFMSYKAKKEREPEGRRAPTRIIFYRDGVSEGQFKQVLDEELAAIKKACEKLGINPTITFVVVGKRHHIRFFPIDAKDADSLSGNCPAGTVVDREIAHPLEYDFYLQSHAGLLGTSRPSHYSVLYDDFGFQPNALQSLTFILCHVYARSTRSVSIPTPVYYADIVCSRSKNHYDPRNVSRSDSASGVETQRTSGPPSLETFRQQFKPLHPKMKLQMYFS